MARNPTRIGRYELLSALAIGGMGRIFLGRTTSIGGFERTVVVKTLEIPVGEARDPAITMFLDEARLLGLLHHHHIATVIDVGRDDDGRHYIALDYVDGYSAHDVVERANELGAALPLDFSFTIVSAVASALHYAHTRKDAAGVPLGIVHRDVTPSNVMIGHDGAVKLIDFGIAMATDRQTKTQTGFVKGKVGYLSPEQVAGREIDGRTDVFALGVLLYELTTLHRAFRDSSDLATMQRIKAGKVVRPSRIVADYPPELERIVMRALQVDPRERFADADSMRRAIEALGHQMRFVLGDAAVMEVMAQLYEPSPPGTFARPQSRMSDPALEWNESEHDLTVRRDPQELLAAMRADALASVPDPEPPAKPGVRPRKLRAATEAADALVSSTDTGGATVVRAPGALPGMAAPPAPSREPRSPGPPPAPGRDPRPPPEPRAAPPPPPAPSRDAGPSREPRPPVSVEEPPDAARDAAPAPAAAVRDVPPTPAEVAVAAEVPRVSGRRSAVLLSPAPTVGAGLVQARAQRSARARWGAAIAVVAGLGGLGYVIARSTVAKRGGAEVSAGSAGSAGSAAAGSAALAAGSAAPTVDAGVAAADAGSGSGSSDAGAGAPATVRLRISTRPADATVILDSKRLGHTPLDLELPSSPGRHVLKLRRRGYVTQSVELDLRADVAYDVTLTPQR